MVTYLKKECSILDVRVCLNNQIEIDIEIQVLLFPFWEERSIFYLCKMFSDQIKEGESYQKLEKCIHVGILDYVLFPEDEEYYSRFHLKEDNRERIYSDKLEIHILELPKLEEKEYPKNALLNWAKFFKAEQKEELKAMIETCQEIAISQQETLSQIVKKCDLSEETARNYLLKYWKDN